MRALDIVIFVVCIAAVTGTIPILFPGFNNGNGFDLTPEATGDINTIAKMQVSGLTPQLTFLGTDDPSLLDYGRMAFQLLWMSLVWAITLLSVLLFAIPIINAIFPGIPIEFTAIIQVIIYVALVVAVIQIVSKQTWGGTK